MPLSADHDWQRRVIERAKELDHEHRRRRRRPWQSAVGLTLSLRFLRTAARQLLTTPRRAEPRRVEILRQIGKCDGSAEFGNALGLISSR